MICYKLEEEEMKKCSEPKFQQTLGKWSKDSLYSMGLASLLLLLLFPITIITPFALEGQDSSTIISRGSSLYHPIIREYDERS